MCTVPEDYRKNRARAQLALLALVLLGTGCTTTLEPGPQALGASDLTPDRFTHTVFDGVLREYVDSEGRVEYARLAEESTALDRYYTSLARRSPDSHPALFHNDSERLAYWINAYNAAVLKLVLEHYPIESVEDVPNPKVLFFAPRLAGFFYFSRIVLGGDELSLYALENSIIRERFSEPRIHFALNCASSSCPRLPARAFDAAVLDAQLEAETRTFIAERRNVAIDPDAGTITLSSIFAWYESDFLEAVAAGDDENRNPTLVDYIEPYLDSKQGVALRRCSDCRVEFAPYDWRLNDIDLER